ncbi:MAG: gliding motility-associated C-terminal domain-containing protein [Fimbriimonadaceae bacterium]|nr:gliding motility-associated C-terminal domain-containing protein [Chitinophagales bacterium]
MKISLLIWLLLIKAFIFAQWNLIKNESFEEYNTCPEGLDAVDTSSTDFPWVIDWFKPIGFATTDYYNVCAESIVSIPETFVGYRETKTGNAFGGIIIYVKLPDDIDTIDGYPNVYREYFQTKLKDTLQEGICYYVEFWVGPAYREATSIWEEILYGTDDIGAYFSENRPEPDDPWLFGLIEDVVPQIANPEDSFMMDVTKWYEVSGTFIASGGEEYMTIGNFLISDSTDVIPIELPSLWDIINRCCYVFIEDVTVASLSPEAWDLMHDTTLCAGDTLTFNYPIGALSYTWNTGDTTNSIQIDSEGLYILTAVYPCITLYDSAYIYLTTGYTTFTFLDTTICNTNLPIELNASPGYANYLWNTGDTTNTIEIFFEGEYVVMSSISCLSGIDSFIVTVIDSSEFYLNIGNDSTLCSNFPISINIYADDGFDNYLWSTGDTTQQIGIYEDGYYSIETENICGVWTDAIEFSVMDPPVPVYLGEDQALCTYTGITFIELNAGDGQSSYLWNAGSTQQIITIEEPGIYYVTCSNKCGSVSDLIEITQCENIYVPNAFSPNGDGVNDFFTIYTGNDIQILYVTIFNRWGEIIFQTNDPAIIWDGTHKNVAQPSEVYSYVINYLIESNPVMAKGNITLVK